MKKQVQLTMDTELYAKAKADAALHKQTIAKWAEEAFKKKLKID